MKKHLIIGAIALVVVGCVLAAGCTSTSTNTTTPATTTEDFAVGTWSTDDGATTVVLTNDFKGVITENEEKTNITWKKTADDNYTFIRDKDSALVNVTIDKNNGLLTFSNGPILTKNSSTRGTATLHPPDHHKNPFLPVQWVDIPGGIPVKLPNIPIKWVDIPDGIPVKLANI